MINEIASWVLTVGIFGELVFAVCFIVWIAVTNRRWRKKQKKDYGAEFVRLFS